MALKHIKHDLISLVFIPSRFILTRMAGGKDPQTHLCPNPQSLLNISLRWVNIENEMKVANQLTLNERFFCIIWWGLMWSQQSLKVDQGNVTTEDCSKRCIMDWLWRCRKWTTSQGIWVAFRSWKGKEVESMLELQKRMYPPSHLVLVQMPLWISWLSE
jgi:hypothetical protein